MNVCCAVQVFWLARLSPIVLAVPPLYVPENERVESVAERLARFCPSDIPEIVEFWRFVLVMTEDGSRTLPDVTVRPLEDERPAVESCPEMEEVAVVDVALNDPKVGVEVETNLVPSKASRVLFA